MKISIGDLFVFNENVVGYISDIVLNKYEKASVYYSIAVMNHLDLEAKVYKYHEDSLRSFVEKSPHIKYYPIIK